jgi:hypothetical protein
MSWFKIPKIYVQLSRQGITVRNLVTGKTHVDSETAPFSHPRVIIADFKKAQAALQRCLMVVRSSSILKPKLLLQWVGPLEGELTETEKQILQQIGQASGAMQVYIVTHTRPLGDADFQEMNGKIPF